MDDKAEAIALGARAQQLLDDPFVQKLFAEIEQERLEKWRHSPVRDKEAREEIWQHIQAIDFIKGKLADKVATARNAQTLLDQENERRRIERESDEQIAAQLDIPVEVIRAERERKD